MTPIKTKFTTLTFLLMLISTTLSADVKQQNTQAPCSTSVECDAMAKDLQRKIDVLENKADLSKNEKKLRYNLRKQILTVKNVQVAQKDAEIAEEKAKQAEENAKQAELRRSQDKKLEELRALLKK